MTIHYTRGNLLLDDAEALVNTVNCVGVMGKGIALQFKKAFPEVFETYRDACERGEVRPGHMFVVEREESSGPRYVVHFPTKRHWRQKSRMDDIEAGLESLAAEIDRRDLRSIAIPPLGCGNGGLEWSEVRPRIEATLAAFPQLDVRLYAPPDSAPSADPVASRQEGGAAVDGLSDRRAAFLGLLGAYQEISLDSLRLLEIQKLAYFLQAAGEPLGLVYRKHRYGPYAVSLNRTLDALEGQHISGFGSVGIRVRPESLAQARRTLTSDDPRRTRIDRVLELVAGHETPHALEALATVHWLGTEDPSARHDSQRALELFQQWNERKKAAFDETDILAAWQRLRDSGWWDETVDGAETRIPA